MLRAAIAIGLVVGALAPAALAHHTTTCPPFIIDADVYAVWAAGDGVSLELPTGELLELDGAASGFEVGSWDRFGGTIDAHFREGDQTARLALEIALHGVDCGTYYFAGVGADLELAGFPGIPDGLHALELAEPAASCCVLVTTRGYSETQAAPLLEFRFADPALPQTPGQYGQGGSVDVEVPEPGFWLALAIAVAALAGLVSFRPPPQR